MPVSTVTIQHLNIELSSVADVVITDIVQDQDIGDFVRDIRFMGAPFIGGEQYLLMQVRIRSATMADLDISAPPQKF